VFVVNGAFYFRINQAEQDSLKEPCIADEGSYISYLEGCTHRVVTKPAACRSSGIVALDDAEIKYSTVQNWYPGNKEGKGGVFNFVTKGICEKKRKISWTQVETGSAVTWKYPSVILKGAIQLEFLFDCCYQ
jgi:Fe-S cluster assembly protein SufB